MHVLPMSDGSATAWPSTRPPPLSPVRQPPPWVQPPSSCWPPARKVRPFLTVSLSAFGSTAHRCAPGLAAALTATRGDGAGSGSEVIAHAPRDAVPINAVSAAAGRNNLVIS